MNLLVDVLKFNRFIIYVLLCIWNSKKYLY